jgi:hypothetical protein
MLAPFCPVHGKRVLLWPDEIRTIRNLPDAMVVEWTCSCGYEGRSRFRSRRATVSSRARRLLA